VGHLLVHSRNLFRQRRQGKERVSSPLAIFNLVPLSSWSLSESQLNPVTLSPLRHPPSLSSRRRGCPLDPVVLPPDPGIPGIDSAAEMADLYNTGTISVMARDGGRARRGVVAVLDPLTPGAAVTDAAPGDVGSGSAARSGSGRRFLQCGGEREE
jgi:hypothetical protein